MTFGQIFVPGLLVADFPPVVGLVVILVVTMTLSDAINNAATALVMGPGGYHFSDYWRMGLPLEILIVAVGTPIRLLVWPLT